MTRRSHRNGIAATERAVANTLYPAGDVQATPREAPVIDHTASLMALHLRLLKEGVSRAHILTVAVERGWAERHPEGPITDGRTGDRYAITIEGQQAAKEHA